MIVITQGDTAVLSLTANTGEGVAFDLTGAVFTSYIRKSDGTNLSIANSAHTADPDQTNNKGKFTVSLTTSDTASLGLGQRKDIMTKVVQGATTIYFHGTGALTVLAADLNR